MRRLLNAATLLGALAAAACGALSERECRATDWAARGYADGLSGQPVRLAQYRAECEAIRPDEAAYREGHAAGLTRFCTPAGAYQAGRQGTPATHACGPLEDERFRGAYERGLEMAQQRERLREVRRAVDQLGVEARRATLPGQAAQDDWLSFQRQDGERRLEWLRIEAQAFDRLYSSEYGVRPLTPFELELQR